jgi:hypothetical protein
LEESHAAHTASPLCQPGDVPLHRAYSMAMVAFAPGWLLARGPGRQLTVSVG